MSAPETKAAVIVPALKYQADLLLQAKENGTKVALARHRKDEATARHWKEYQQKCVECQREELRAEMRKNYDDAYREEAQSYMPSLRERLGR